MPGFNLLTKALFSFQLGGLEGLKLRNLWPDRTQLQSTMIWLEATAGLIGFVVLAPHSLKERKVALYLCARMCVLCSNCVGSAPPTEHSAVWVMHCFSIGSDVQPPTWHECLQPSCSSLPSRYLEPAESGSHSPVALHHLSHPQNFSLSIYQIFTLNIMISVWIITTFKKDNFNDTKLPVRWCHLANWHLFST